LGLWAGPVSVLVADAKFADHDGFLNVGAALLWVPRPPLVPILFWEWTVLLAEPANPPRGTGHPGLFLDAERVSDKAVDPNLQLEAFGVGAGTAAGSDGTDWFHPHLLPEEER
jgi:hypothetical protein